MLTTKNINVFEGILTDKILNRVSEEEIFRRYVPFSFDIGKIYISPLRSDDKVPSFGIYFNNYFNKLMYKDYREKQGDCFNFVKELYGITYSNALQRVCKDFNLDCQTDNYKPELSVKTYQAVSDRYKIKYSIVRKEFTSKDIAYWEQYGIDINTLNFFNVYRVYKLYMNGYLHRISSDNYPTYCYYFPRTDNMKLYSPFNTKKDKWKNNANNEWDIQGYDQLPETGDVCILTKSMKDVMTLYRLGYNAVATHSESEFINPDFIRHITGRFKRVILLFDNDKQGKAYTEKLSEKFCLNYGFIPEESGQKDISDYYKEYGKEESTKLLKKLIYESD